jgi:hypothetical protein
LNQIAANGQVIAAVFDPSTGEVVVDSQACRISH